MNIFGMVEGNVCISTKLEDNPQEITKIDIAFQSLNPNVKASQEMEAAEDKLETNTTTQRMNLNVKNRTRKQTLHCNV